MQDLYYIVAVIIGFIIIAIIHKIGKNKNPVKRALTSMLTGLFTLIGVNVAGMFTNVYIPCSMLSIVVSMLGGIPGVTMLLSLNLFF